MDGLLINTEDIYTIVTNELLSEFNKGPLSWDVKINLQGRTSEIAAGLVIKAYDLPYTPQEWIAKNIAKQKQYWSTCSFLPGAEELLRYLHDNKIPFALATSSSTINYERKTGHLRHIFDLFGEHIVTGDDPRVQKGRGKPYPDIYLAALKSLNDQLPAGQPIIQQDEVLVFEDGLPGVESGKAAGAYVIWVPHPEALKLLNGKENDHIGESGIVLNSLIEFDPKSFGL
ncbi:hypothetical protein WICMUC_005049 [Wickerhamomyces mucosus]|uniref:Uncharacterized protein n=1 Tax=Wickerhamomyces mucosus TaxID=1378264 RepID=A0A9P8PCL0_9ASCO|nr:hypothetical protein WICMUC_005049 [Wickerhamomyces mucosus]